MLSISQTRPEPEPLKARKMLDDSSVDSGQETLSASGESEIYFSSESSSYASSSSVKMRGSSKIVHSYIASRGQRERETDIYEVNPPPPLLSCRI